MVRGVFTVAYVNFQPCYNDGVVEGELLRLVAGRGGGDDRGEVMIR
jgi:hypothetical protein